MSVYIIAEAGVNHNGSIDTACRLADAAKEAGADCVKFQTFKTDKLVARGAQKADYQRKETGDGSQGDMLKSLELKEKEFCQLKAYCDEIGMTFLSTPFDPDSIAFLETMGMPFWKIPSGEVTNYPYLVDIARTGKPVVMSTGMCEMKEIHEAMSVLRENGCQDIALLHCNTEYPTPYEDVNLRAMQTMHEEFGCKVGYSDHTRGIEVPIAAVAMGASIIEKHFTLDRNMQGPDHRASLEPGELKKMIQSIRNIEAAMGNGIKAPSLSEIKNRSVARKSIVARRAIKSGEYFTEENITSKRPGTGISPMRWREILGLRANRDYEEDELIEL